MSYIFIGLGGAIGALTRYIVGSWLNSKWKGNFPGGTFVINITGAFCLGVISSLLINHNYVDKNLGLFVTTGFLGGYTTFSTFIYENIKLIDKGLGWQVFKYILATNVLGILAGYLGIKLGGLV
jgi:fluoride exporter